jgi:predicted permease
MLRVPLAFEPDHLVTVSVGTPAKFFATDAEQLAVQKQVIDRIAALPGVESVGAGSVLPVSFNGNTDWIRFVGRPYDGHHIEVNGRSATPTYFHTLRTHILRGRDFTAEDTADHPLVAIINRRLQEKYFPGEDPIGKQIGNTELAQKSIKQIVGVVDDLHEGALDQPLWPAVYYPEAQSPDSYTAVIARVSGDPRSFLPTMVSVTQGVHRELSVSDEMTFDDKIHDSQSAILHRGAAWLVGAFAVVALLLSAVGMYGVISYSVSTRTREIGVRIALGAQREAIYMLVLREAGMLSGIGIVLGLALAIGTAALLRSLLFGVTVWDPTTLVASIVLLAGCSMLASFLPARQAATVDPVNALRSE